MKRFDEFDEKEQKIILKENKKFFQKEYVVNEKEKLLIQFTNELKEFQSKLELLEVTVMSVEISSNNCVEFKGELSLITIEEIKEDLKKEYFEEINEEALENIEWFKHLPDNEYWIDLEMDNNLFHLEFMTSYTYSHYLYEGCRDERLRILSECKEEKIKKAIVEFQIKSVFEKDRNKKNQEVDKILAMAIDEKIKWIKKIEDKINNELIKLEENMNQRIEHIVSDQFLFNKLNESEELFIDEFYRIVPK